MAASEPFCGTVDPSPNPLPAQREGVPSNEAGGRRDLGIAPTAMQPLSPRGEDRVRGRGNLLVGLARSLRQRETRAERALWSTLLDRRLATVKFRRQYPVGPYVVDFCAPGPRVIIEVDGGQHAGSKADRQRDAALRSLGYRVLRFWNTEVLGRRRTVLERIVMVLDDPHPSPLPAQGEGVSIDDAGGERDLESTQATLQPLSPRGEGRVRG